jgi:hypothetical protein
MLLPTQQSCHGVNIGDIRSNNQRGHRETRFALQAHLPNKRANKAVCEIIHAG